MTTRQTGHFFFEPRDYDEVNEVSDEYKEDVKVGYNIRRKVVLLAVWFSVPILLALQPSLFGLIAPFDSTAGYIHDVGIAWLIVGVAGLLFRGFQLTLQRGHLVAIAWMTKICTDPFHDIGLYWRAPFALLRGEWIDPMLHIRAGHGSESEAHPEHLSH